MSGTLFGQEKSGTPLETRRGTEFVGADLIKRLSGPGGGTGRLVTDARTSALGFDPAILNMISAAASSISDPRDRTRGLFAALEPFERRQTDEARADLRGGFGRLGGRFGRNRDMAEAQLISSLNEGFARTREQALLQAQEQRNNALAALMQASIQGRALGVEELGQILQFFRPGEPNFQEGIFGDLLEAGGNISAAAILA